MFACFKAIFKSLLNIFFKNIICVFSHCQKGHQSKGKKIGYMKGYAWVNLKGGKFQGEMYAYNKKL